MTLKGNLEVLNLSDIFQSLSLNQHTGTLRVTDGKREKLIYFAQGEITLLSSDKKLRIGDMLVAAGKISQEDLEYALSQQKKTKKKLGEILVEEGFVTEDDVAEVVKSQIEEEIYDLFLWKKADFEFLIDYCPDKLKNPAHQVTKLQFNTNSLIMEALRRLDEWELISKEIPTLKEVYKVVNASPAALEEIDLPDRVKAEIKLIDGERTVEAIAEETTLGEFELCKLLYELKTRKIIAPLTPQELADRADECFQKGKFRQASALYERLAEVLPKNLSIRWHLADSLKGFGDEAKALEQYEFIARKLEGSRDRVELARCYNGILELAPDRRDIAEKLRALDKQQWKRTATRAMAYLSVATVIAVAIVVFGIRSDTLNGWLERAKTALNIGGGELADAARNERAARELLERAEALQRESKLRESFETAMKVLTHYPKTGPASLVVLPLKIDTIPSGKEIWLNGVLRERTPRIVKYIPNSEDIGKTPLRVEIREAGRVLWVGDLDPTTFHDLTIDLFKKPVWREQTDGAVRSKPVFSGTGKDSAVYYSSYDGYIRGLRLEDRAPLAKLPLRDNVDPFGEVTSDPAVAGDLLVVGTLDGRALIFDLVKRAKVADQRVSDAPVLARPAILHDGQVAAFAGDDGEISFLSLARRSVLGRASVYCSNRVTALVAAGNRVLVSSRDNWVRAIDATAFDLRWPVEMRGDVTAAPGVGEKVVVIGDRTGQVVCVEREKGTRRWEADAGGSVTGVEVDGPRAIVATRSGTVRALDLEAGRLEWLAHVQPGAGPPVVAQETIFVASAGPPPAAGQKPPLGYLQALDAKTGEERWTAQFPAPVRGSPAVYEGFVYVGCDDGCLYCFEIR